MDNWLTNYPVYVVKTCLSFEKNYEQKKLMALRKYSLKFEDRKIWQHFSPNIQCQLQTKQKIKMVELLKCDLKITKDN